MRAHNAAALQIAEWLESRPEVERVFYAGLTSHPQHELARTQMDGFSGLVSFVLRGGMERAVRLVNSLRLFGIGVSWGGFESLALPIDPTATHSPEICAAIGVAPGFIRLSNGLEDVEDLIDDLERGFNEVRDD
jgi:cystathionine gamma-lyase